MGCTADEERFLLGMFPGLLSLDFNDDSEEPSDEEENIKDEDEKEGSGDDAGEGSHILVIVVAKVYHTPWDTHL